MFTPCVESRARTKQAAADHNAGRSKAMPANKSNPRSHGAGATATPHPATPDFPRHGAAQGARPRLPAPVNRPACTAAPLLSPSPLPHPAPRPQESPGGHQLHLPALRSAVFLERGKTTQPPLRLSRCLTAPGRWRQSCHPALHEVQKEDARPLSPQGGPALSEDELAAKPHSAR